MKTIISRIFCFFATVSCFFACEDNTVDYALGEYYQNIATVLNDSVYLLDSGEALYNINYRANKAFDADKRIFLTYSLEKEKNAPCGHAILLHGASEITLGELKIADKIAIDSLPAHPVRLESVWVGSHYLNMRFYFDYRSKTHSIGLFADDSCLSGDTLHLYFRHNTNQDSPGYPVHLFLSFDLEKVLGKPGGESSKQKCLQVFVNSSNYADKSYKFKY
ncbi:MAG: hypothetical protein LBP72_02450 [Dysgonamonadaceae bacterium]|jgi:hypothetical protein|nr:hypothetical protein [Dysgonamonadaceae bacterium]